MSTVKKKTAKKLRAWLLKKKSAKRIRSWLRFLFETKVHPDTVLEVSSDCRKFAHGLLVVGAVGGVLELDKVNSSEAMLLSFAGFTLWLGAMCLHHIALSAKKAKEKKDDNITHRIRNASDRCHRRR